MSGKHTLTPWEMNNIGEPDDNLRISQWERMDAGKVDIAIIPVGFSEPFESEQQANAAFIVRACNNFEALVAAAEHAREVLSTLYAKYGLAIGPYSSQAQLCNVELGAALRAALKQTTNATGGAE